MCKENFMNKKGIMMGLCATVISMIGVIAVVNPSLKKATIAEDGTVDRTLTFNNANFVTTSGNNEWGFQADRQIDLVKLNTQDNTKICDLPATGRIKIVDRNGDAVAFSTLKEIQVTYAVDADTSVKNAMYIVFGANPSFSPFQCPGFEGTNNEEKTVSYDVTGDYTLSSRTNYIAILAGSSYSVVVK